MRARTIITAIACTFACSDLAPANRDQSPAQVRIQPSLTGNAASGLPAFTAPLTEALLQPGDHYSEGLYRNRTFGCCSPAHLGTDFAGAAGTPVIALASGVVLPEPVSGPHCNYGNVVVVWSKHVDGSDFAIVYGHLSGRPGMEPTLSGVVHRGDIIGYIAHTGGTSPSGERCGSDDENGDGDEHVHIGLRYGRPATDANGNPRWVYYGYAGNGESADNFGSIVDFANCRGTHAGLHPDGQWDASSTIIANTYCEDGGYALLGDSQNVGGGNGLVDRAGVLCQHFRRADQSYAESSAICLDPQQTGAIAVPWMIWFPYSMIGADELGAPTSEAQATQIGARQSFERGTIETSGSSARVTLSSGTVYTVDGDLVTRTDPDAPMPGTSSASSSSSSSSSSGSLSSSSEATSSASSTSSSSSSSSSASSSSTSSSSTGGTHEDPPYTDCGRHGFNLVVNGDFNLPPLQCGWMLENALGGGHAEQACAGGECRARVWTTTPSDPWRTQLKTYVHVYAGTNYLFKFNVRAEGAADRFIVQLMNEDSPWTNYGLWIDTEIPAGIEQTFEIPFTATTTDHQARLTFQFGQTSTAFVIDKLYLEQLPY